MSYLTNLLLGIVTSLLVMMSLSSLKGEEPDLKTSALSEIKKVGVALFLYANDHHGRFPDSLDVLKGGEYIDEILLLDENTGKVKWQITTGLRTTDKTDTILLRSVNSVAGGKVVYLVDGSVKWIKDDK